MKNIDLYYPSKYNTDSYAEEAKGVYRNGALYVTSFSFEQEPEYGEGISCRNISQYPLEDILERFCVHITDYYENENADNKSICVLEFGSSSICNILKLHTILGKHVFNVSEFAENQEYIILKIE